MLPRDDSTRLHDVTFAAVRITCHFKIIPGFDIGAFVAYQLVLEAATATEVIRALSRSRTFSTSARTYSLICRRYPLAI